MRYLNIYNTNDLYLDQSEVVEAIIAPCVTSKTTSKQKSKLIAKANNTIELGKFRGSRIWEAEKDPTDNRRTVIRYESMSEKYKILVQNRFGDPYRAVVKKPIKDMVITDHEAERFYLDHRYGENKPLERIHVAQYTKQASWLNMIREVNEDKKGFKEDFSITIDQFYTYLFELFEEEEVKLPRSYRRLMYNKDSAYKRYIEKGYEALINPRFGNKYAAKINDQKSDAVLYNLLADGRQFDDVFIAKQYNVWAVQNGYKTITDGAVGYYRKKHSEELTVEREGLSPFKDKFVPKLQGKRPSAPLYLMENDDNHLDMTFKQIYFDDNGRQVTNNHARYKAIVVTDSFNDLVLGYAYDLGSVTADLVKAALINALYYIKGLTGAWYLPHEIKNDKFATKELKPFYKELGIRLEPRIGNKHRGYIEQFFGSTHWKNSMKLASDKNFIGNNIDSLTRGFNVEEYTQNAKTRPLIGNGAEKIVEQHFYNCRQIPQENGLSKEREWLKAWGELDDAKKRKMSDEQMLMKFGIEHSYRGKGTSITSKGVNFLRDGVEYKYTLDEYRGDLIGRKVSVIFDPYDMSRVLITNHEDIRLMAHETRLVPRAIADYEVDSLQYIRALQQQQNEYANNVVSRSIAKKEAASKYGIDPEAILQAGVLDKGERQLAEAQIHQIPEKRNDNENFNPLELL